ncbi:MAG: DUF4396 domain-containing protein [Gemmatimonadaceae bacterium]
MVPVMALLMTRDMRAMDPTSLRFWGAMSLATLAGFVVAYPVNVWLVAARLKHGMGTVRALGRGGHGVVTEQALLSDRRGHSGHAGDTTVSSAGQERGEPRRAAAAAPQSARLEATTASGHATNAATTTPAQVTAVAVLTVLALAAGVLIAALGGDLSMSHAAGHAGPAAESGNPTRMPHQMR